MKTLKKTLCLVLAVVMVVGVLVLPASAASSTTDLGEKYKEALSVLDAIDLMKGDEGGLRPNDTITRAEAATVVARMLLGVGEALDYPTDNLPFEDVDAGAWYAPYIAYCYDNGIVAGDERGFAPEDDVTGYEFAKMVLVALGYDEAPFVTPDWQTNVFAALREAKLNDNITGITWTAPMKRGEVAQFALNGLLYTDDDAKIYTIYFDNDGGTPNKYDEGIDDLLRQTKDYDEAMLFAQSTGAKVDIAKDTEGSLANEVYNGLRKVDTGVYDGFGRPAVQWTNDAEEDLYTYAKKANRTYNGTFTETNFNNLKDYSVYYNNDVADPEFVPYINGAVGADGVALKINGNGVPGYEVEIYTSERRIIVREAYLAEVSEVANDSLTVTGYVRVESGTEKIEIAVTSEDDIYETLTAYAGGYAAVYFKSGAAQEGTADYILEVAALDEVKTDRIYWVEEGGYAVNSIVHTDGNTKGYGLNYMFMVLKAGETEIEQKYPGLGTSKIYTYNGNILFIDQSPETETPVITDSYAYLWDSKLIATYGSANGGNQDWESGDGFEDKDSSTNVDTITAAEVRVRLVFADGTMTPDEGVKVKSINGTEINATNITKGEDYENLVVVELGKLVYYSKNSDGTYNLITIDPETSATITPKKSEGTVGSVNVAFDSKTVFMVVTTKTDSNGNTNYLVDEKADFYDIYEITTAIIRGGQGFTAVQAIANFETIPTDGEDFWVEDLASGATTRTDIPRVVLIVLTDEEPEEDPLGEVYFIVDNVNAVTNYTYAEDGVTEIWYKELNAVVNGNIEKVKVAFRIGTQAIEVKFNTNGTLLTIDPEKNNGIIVAADPADHVEVTAVGACVNMRIDITDDSDDMVNYLVNTELAGDRAFEYSVEDGTIKLIDLEKLDAATAKNYKAGHAVINSTLDYLFVTTVEGTVCDLTVED